MTNGILHRYQIKNNCFFSAVVGKVNEYSRDDEFDGENEEQFAERIRQEAVNFALQTFEYDKFTTFKTGDEIDGISETMKKIISMPEDLKEKITSEITAKTAVMNEISQDLNSLMKSASETGNTIAKGISEISTKAKWLESGQLFLLLKRNSLY